MRMSDPDKTVCEACGAPELEKLISHTAFALKGGGWYKDLYASTKPEGAASATPAATEAKPAAAAESTAAAPAAPAAAPATPATPAASGSHGGLRFGLFGFFGRREHERFVIGQIIDGTAIAAKLRGEVATAAAALRTHHQIAPTLAVVLVGDDPASAVYVKAKAKAAREANVDVRDHKLPATTTQAELMALVAELNADPIVDGILVQLPLSRSSSTAMR